MCKSEKIDKLLLLILAILLPFHFFVFSILINNGWTNLWKELLLLILVFRMIFVHRTLKFTSLNLIEWLLLSSTLFFFLYSFFSGHLIQSLLISRVYILPMSLVFIVRRLKIVDEDLSIILKYIAIVSIILVTYGVIQQFFLGEKFLLDMGYQGYLDYWGNTRLGASFYLPGVGYEQRLVSTFSAPNTAGLWFSLSLTLLLFLGYSMNRKLRIISISFLVVGIILTFSRSIWIVTLIMITVYLLYKKMITLIFVRRVIRVLIMILCLLIVVDYFMGFKNTHILTNFIVSSIKLNDTSSIGHIDSLKNSLSTVISNPLGTGLGNNGPRALAFTENAILTESSYFLMTFELGILGSLVYFCHYLVALFMPLMVRNKKSISNITFFSKVVLIQILIVFLVLPFVQEFEILFILYISIGLSCNDIVFGNSILNQTHDIFNKKRILYLMHVDWKHIKQRPQFLAESLANYFNVLVIYPFANKRSKLQKSKTNTPHLNRLSLISIPLGGRFKPIRIINRIVHVSFLSIVRFVYIPDYVWICHPNMFYLRKGREILIYECMDDYYNLSINDAERMNVVRYEEKIVSLSDVIITTSNNLKIVLENKYNNDVIARKIHVVRNGFGGNIIVDSNHQQSTNYCNERIEIGYIGTISNWFDFDSILEVLDRFKNIEFHLIGPIEEGTKVAKDERIIYHGTVEHDNLYNSIINMDCLIMPFVVNKIVESVDPVKLYEYINFNKPIVSVYYDEIERFERYVDFYNSENSLAKVIEGMIISKFKKKYSDEERNAFLKDNSWSNRGKEVELILTKNKEKI